MEFHIKLFHGGGRPNLPSVSNAGAVLGVRGALTPPTAHLKPLAPTALCRPPQAYAGRGAHLGGVAAATKPEANGPNCRPGEVAVGRRPGAASKGELGASESSAVVKEGDANGSGSLTTTIPLLAFLVG